MLHNNKRKNLNKSKIKRGLRKRIKKKLKKMKSIENDELPIQNRNIK